MATISLRADWDYSVELLHLDFSSLQKGQRVLTEELWNDGFVVVYQPEVLSVTKPPRGASGKYRVELRYDEQAPQHRGIKRASEVVWGDFYFEVDIVDNWRATAGKIISGKMDPEYNVNSDVVVLDSDLLEQEWETVTRVKRIGQDRLRDDLLLRDGGCAITGETFKDVLEAAHIVSATDRGAAHWDNCFLLRADLHRLYDARPRRLHISPEGVVTIEGAPHDKQTVYANAPSATLNPNVLKRVSAALARKAALENGTII